MVELDEASRIKDVDEGIKRGNHYGAEIFKTELEKKFSKEIKLGWMLPLPPGTEKLLPHAEYCPTSMIDQMTIDSVGSSKRGDRFQSFLQSHSKTSVNGRVHKPLLDECLWPHALPSCTLHTFSAAAIPQQENPDQQSRSRQRL